MSPTLDRYFQEYAESHQHPTNRLTHKVALPFIVFHTLVMLDWCKLPGPVFATLNGAPYGLSVGHVFFVAVILWYATMSPKLAGIMALAFLPAFPIGAFIPKLGIVVIAIVAWTIQFAGHAIWEKRSPAFLQNLVQALIGPLFFVAVLTGDWKMPRQATA